MLQTEFKQQILFMGDIEQIIGVNRITLRRWWLTGKFPKPIKLNGSLLSWHFEVIQQWINQRMNINNELNSPTNAK
jgi:prophage regulatory protein